MSLRMSDLSGSAYSTPTRSRFSSNYGSLNDSQNKTNTKQLSSDILASTLSASMKKQSEKSELFDIELEDLDYYRADRTIEEINMLAAKSFAYSKNSGLTNFKPNDQQNAFEDQNDTKFGFVPIKATPTKTKTPKYNKYDFSGKSFFSEPHIYPRKPQNQAYQDSAFTGEFDEPFGNFEFFRATPTRRPPELL